jgi:hypothetical protein
VVKWLKQENGMAILVLTDTGMETRVRVGQHHIPKP